MKTSFTHCVGKPGSLGTFAPHIQSLTKPLSICKIACVSTVNADTPETVIMHQAFIRKLTVETAVVAFVDFNSSNCDRKGQSYPVEYYLESVEEHEVCLR